MINRYILDKTFFVYIRIIVLNKYYLFSFLTTKKFTLGNHIETNLPSFSGWCVLKTCLNLHNVNHASYIMHGASSVMDDAFSLWIWAKNEWEGITNKIDANAWRLDWGVQCLDEPNLKMLDDNFVEQFSVINISLKN